MSTIDNTTGLPSQNFSMTRSKINSPDEKKSWFQKNVLNVASDFTLSSITSPRSSKPTRLQSMESMPNSVPLRAKHTGDMNRKLKRILKEAQNNRTIIDYTKL
jgi:hypothetical protein